MKYRLLLLFCFSSFYSIYSQNEVLIPSWEIGKNYEYKMTYTIDASDLFEDESEAISVDFYYTLIFQEQSANHWDALLRFDKIENKPDRWDGDAVMRFLANQFTYELRIPKGSQKLEIRNLEELINYYYVFYQKTGNQQRAEEVKVQLRKLNEQEPLLAKDFLFLFSNNYKKLDYQNVVKSDSLTTEFQIETEEFFRKTNGVVEYKHLNKIKEFPKRDTIQDFVYFHKQNISTQTTIVKYDKDRIPFLSEVNMHLDTDGIEVSKMNSDYKSDMGGKGSMNEVVRFELVRVY